MLPAFVLLTRTSYLITNYNDSKKISAPFFYGAPEFTEELNWYFVV